MPLPPLPGHRLSIVGEATPPPAERGFIFVRGLKMVATFADGTTSATFPYDVADRTRLDAIVIVPHYRGEDGRRYVILRSALRPPVAVRPRG